MLKDLGRLDNAVIEPDLSSVPLTAAAERWRDARARGQCVVLCANEGPLLEFMQLLAADPVLASTAAELGQQLGRLVVPRPELLPREPQRVLLIDLADRTLQDQDLIARAIQQVSSDDFYPERHYEQPTSAGRNQQLFYKLEHAAQRMGRLLALAAQRSGTHISFRALWAAITYMLCRGRPATHLSALPDLAELPLDNLLRCCTCGSRRSSSVPRRP